MIIQVNQKLCAGCGACMDVCATGAIQFVDQRAVINESLCTQCQACLEACPNEAITAIHIPAQILTSAVQQDSGSIAVPVQQSGNQSSTAALAPRLAPLAGTVMAFLWHDVAPHLVEIIINTLERKVARPATTSSIMQPKNYSKFSAQLRGERKQTRFRGGRAE